MDDENFYKLVSRHIDATQDKLSALDKILKAFAKEDEERKTEEKKEKIQTDDNLKEKKQ